MSTNQISQPHMPKYVVVPKPSVKVHRCGREVCDLKTKAGRDEYFRRMKQMWERQDYNCCICGKALAFGSATFEHEKGRGHNGGHRDDRTAIDGKQINGAAHYWCNRVKGSVRGDYNADKFLADFEDEVMP